MTAGIVATVRELGELLGHFRLQSLEFAEEPHSVSMVGGCLHGALVGLIGYLQAEREVSGDGDSAQRTHARWGASTEYSGYGLGKDLADFKNLILSRGKEHSRGLPHGGTTETVGIAPLFRQNRAAAGVAEPAAVFVVLEIDHRVLHQR